MVLDKENRSGEATSSRNSGVIHAGMYYPNNTLKHELCLRGNQLLYEYAKLKKIPHKKTGKYIVATNKKEISKLEKIFNLGCKNKVELKRVSKDEIKESEPELCVAAGIFSPNSGVIDVPSLINSLEVDVNNNKGIISLNTSCESARISKEIFIISCDSSEKFDFESKVLINASGLESFKTSNNFDFLNKKFIKKIYFAKGHYFKYSGKNPFKKLIYPISNDESLGIHVGMDLEGYLRFGPDIEYIEKIDYTFDSSLKSKFLESIKTYWPNIIADKLNEDYCGVRPKIQNKDEQFKDFSISTSNFHGVKNFINLQGIDSPGLTSSLAIGEYVSSLIE